MNPNNPNSPPVTNNGKPVAAAAAVIRRLEAAEETSQERLVKKHVPAWVISGAIHVAIIALAILVLGARKADTKQPDKIIATTAEKAEEMDEKDLTNEDPGLDTNLSAALPEIQREDEKTAEGIVTQDVVGLPNAPDNATTAYAPPGLTPDLTTPGHVGTEGGLLTGTGGEKGMMNASFGGRSAATKSKLLREGGGNAESEQAVARGLAWLARQQEKDGGWRYDQGRKAERAAATGMALLPFLAAGETHKPNRDKTKTTPDYHRNVNEGLEFLKRMCPLTGSTAGRMSENMYAHAIAAMALCEAYGMTKDPSLRPYAQAAINFVQSAQGGNGSWGYTAGTQGDTSIVGWQIQALQAAKLGGLVVDDRVIKKAIAFLNLAAAGSKKSMYGYRDNAGAAPGTALTAVGLLSRYYIDQWGPAHPGMIDGVGGLMKNAPPGRGKNGQFPEVKDLYYYYYATQVVHFYEGDDWKTWNEGPKPAGEGPRKGGMRDWLVTTQLKDTKNQATYGSWDPEAGTFGSHCGRLGTTAMCLLTLEVYYRHLPLYKRSNNNGAAVQIIE